MKSFRLSGLRLLLFTLLLSISTLGQDKKPAVSIPSANAMTLGTFGDIPVSLFSGLPEITIPIYTISTGNKIEVSIGLSYHAAGVKPDLHPSWVGLGWGLSAGGSINRVIKGYADESKSNNNNTLLGYYYTHAANTRSDWPDGCPSAACQTSFQNYLNEYRNINDLLTDFSPDEFHFSFPGHSGKFFLDDAGNWQVQCDKPVKVEFSGEFLTPFSITSIIMPGYFDNASKPFKKFTITDEFGTKYIFGESESAIEYSDVLVQGDPNTTLNGTEFLATSWQLKRIISPDGVDIIEFNYERGPFQCFLYSAISKSGVFGAGGNFLSLDGSCYQTSTRFSYGGKISSPVYLTSIEYARKNVKIELEKGASQAMSYTHTDYENVVNHYFNTTSYEDENLSKILDYDNPDQIPFFSPDNPAPDERRDRFIWLRLNQINIINSQTKIKLRSVIFNYTNNTAERLKLGSVDFKDANSTKIQSYTFTYNNQSLPAFMATAGDHWGFNNGQPAPVNASPSTIANFYASKNPDYTQAVKGMLQDITYPTGGKTSFEYALHTYSKVVDREDRTVLSNLSGTAGGLRVTRITTTDNAGSQQVKDFFYVKGYETGLDPGSLQSSGILDAIPQYEFSAINGKDNQNINFTLSLFSSNPVIPLSLTSTGQHIGYSEVVEKRSDGAYTIYKFTNHDNGYTDLNATAKWNRSYVPYLPSSSRDFERGRLKEKHVFTVAKKPVQSEIYEWDRLNTNGVRSIQQDYRVICAESAGRAFVSRVAYYLFYYPFVVKKIITKDYQSGSGNDYIQVIQDFTYQDRLPKTVSVTNSKNEELKTEFFYPKNTTGSVYGLMNTGNMLNYVVKEEKYRNNVFEQATITGYKQWSNEGIYMEFVKKKIGTNDPEIELQIHNYDEKGNVLSQTLRNGTRESYLWGNNKTLAIAKVVNARSEDIAYVSFERNENSGLSFNGIPIADYNAPTGRKVYILSSGDVQKTGLNQSLNYIVSYYSKDGSQQVNATAGIPGKTISGYTFYQHKISNPSNGIITITGTGTIDELRIHPEGAQMMTYAYEPLVGMTAQSDVMNRITYFEYDPFGRLVLIRDEDKKILKKLCYQYDQQTENCNIQYHYNQAQTKPYSKTCPSGYDQPAPISYTIPADRYRSTISIEEANLQALADIDALGQAQADATLKCYQHLSLVQFEREVTDTYEDDYTYIEWQDVWIRWYGENIYTPLYLENPLDVHYTISSYFAPPDHYYYTAPIYASEYYLGNLETTYISPGHTVQLFFDVISYGW